MWKCLPRNTQLNQTTEVDNVGVRRVRAGAVGAVRSREAVNRGDVDVDVEENVGRAGEVPVVCRVHH